APRSTSSIASEAATASPRASFTASSRASLTKRRSASAPRTARSSRRIRGTRRWPRWSRCARSPAASRRASSAEMLLVYAARQEASVDGEDLAVDEARRLGREEDRCPAQLVHRTETLHRRAREELAPARRAVEELRVQIGSKHAGRDRIH